MADSEAKPLYADAQPVAGVHPTCLQDYTNDGSAPDGTEIDEGSKRWMETP